MNKTININLGGFFFHIDEEAYKKLRRYLDAISKSLSDDPQGKNEIIADIEARISELLSEKITDARQVVNEADIDEIIKIMGQPEDFSDTENSYENNESSYSYSRNYAVGKKLFRNGDDKFLGGVASGLGQYFNLDVIWIRLIFLALFFGVGTGFLLYIILWILLPEAKTTAEKLQMEGEPVNIDNIEKKIRDEFNTVSTKVKNVAGGVSDKLKEGANEISEKFQKTDFKGTGNKAKSGIQDFLDALGRIFSVLFQVLGKFIGVFLIILSVGVLLALIITGFSIGSFEILDTDVGVYPPFFQGSLMPAWLLTLFSVLLIGIPFLLLLILGLRILSNHVKRFSKVTSLTLFGIWVIAFLAMIFTGIEFGSSHTKYGKSVEERTLNFVENDTISIKMINNDEIYYNHNLRRNNNKEIVEVDGENMLYSNKIYVNVKKSESDKAYLTIKKESRGKNNSTAKNNAKNIKYSIGVDGKTVNLDSFYLTQFKNFWRDEEVIITLFIPENITIYFDYSTKYFLHDIKNTTDTYDRKMVKNYFLMTQKGLHCESLKLLEENED